MKKEKDYIQDIAEIRSMMERTSKFLSLSGWAGIMAGIYALAGAFVAWKILNFHPVERLNAEYPVDRMTDIIIVAIIILSLAIFTAIIDSSRRARTRGETVWNSASKRLLISMSVPLVAGGILILILLSQGFVGLVLPLSLIFYG